MKGRPFYLKPLPAVFLFLSLALLGPTLPVLAGTCTVDATQTNQFIRCIGASSAWSGLGSQAQALFADDAVNGHIGISSLRARIDPNNSFANEVNTLAAAHSTNPNVLLWATEWSPPAQYKGNNSVNGSNTGGNLNGATATFLGASSGSPNSADTGYANYLVSFAQYAQSHGAPLYAISVQNEPNWNPDYEAAIWNAGQFNVFVPVFHNALQSAGLSNIKIMIPEPINPGGLNLGATTMNDPTNSGYVGIIGTHLYGGQASPLSTYGYTHVTNQEWWETEISANSADVPGALQQAGWIHHSLVTANMNAFHYWWLTDLIVNNALNIKAYVLGSYSKFIRPGYYRMGATEVPSSGVSVSAFKNTNTSSPQTIVFVAINGNGSAVNQTFNLNGVNVSSVTPWITNGSNNLVKQSSVAVSGNSFTYSLPASSVISFVAVNNGGSSATNTPTRTNTPAPPTNTPTRTNTPVPPTATFTFTSTPTPIVASSWRVNAGGPSYTDTLGNVWSADTNFSGGNTIGQGGAITGTPDSTLYDTQRYGSTFSYSFNVPAGIYQVTLKLAETYSGDMSTGARIFNISINGSAVVSNLDLFAQVGGNTADDKVINNVSPSGGTITIQFASAGGTDANAVVEALQVIPQPATPTATRTNTPVPPTSTATSTSTSTRTNTPVPPTNTFTSTFTRTNTPVPPTATSTNSFTAVPPTATRTNTPVPPTATDTNSPAPPTDTNTPAPPTATFTATSTRTATPVPPTATNTNSPVPPTDTNTPAPPTATFTATLTRTATPVPPTATNTNSPVPPTNTFTAIPPTATRTNTSIPPTATNTPVPPTATRTNTPVSPTATFTFTPTTVVASGNFKVQLLSGVTSGTTNSPHPQIQVVNTGTGPLALNNVTVRYWFNCDCTSQTEQAWVDWAGLMPVGSTATGNVHVAVQGTALGGQTNYVLYSFTGNMVLQPGQAIQVQSRFNKSDWSNMSQSNDWSFAANTSFVDDAQVTGYLSGGLVWGHEPSSSTSTLTISNALAIPNPSTGTGTTLSFTVGGTSSGTSASAWDSNSSVPVDPNARITLSVYSLSLRLIWTQTVTGGGYGTAGSHELYWDERDLRGAGLANGVYLLRVTIESHGQTSTTLGKILILG